MTTQDAGSWRRRAYWHVRIVWERFTPAMLLLLAMVMLWGGLQWQVIWPLEKQVALNDQQLHEQALAPVSAGSPSATHAVSSRPALPDRFLAFLPELSERDRHIQEMYEMMRRNNLVVGPMEFRQALMADLPIERFSLRFTLQGDYVSLRKALQGLLNRHTHLAILKLGLEKSEAAPSALVMTIEAEAYYRSAGLGLSP
ncbi:MAG: hypothetical protein Q8J78_16330 [Moraxellaceae bacterium]|nr:hypothetical protein [Moraxellaceae bacterium]